MKMGNRLLVSDGGVKETLFRLDDVHELVYYALFEMEAMVQLLQLNDIEAQNRLYSFLCKALKMSGVCPDWKWELTVRGGGAISATGNGSKQIYCNNFSYSSLGTYGSAGYTTEAEKSRF